MMIIDKLPKILKNDPIIHKVTNFIQQGTVLYSSLFYTSENKIYLINRNQHSFIIESDWRIYSIFRAYAKTIITTSNILRAQKDIFQTNCCFGDPYIQLFYKSMWQQHQKQKLYILSQKMTQQEKQKYVNSQLYDLIHITNNGQFKKITSIVEELLKNKTNSPLLLQCGLTTLKQYLKQINLGYGNQIDRLMLSYYSGDMHQSCIGVEFDIRIEQYYDCIWQSQYIKVCNNNIFIGTLHFNLYIQRY